MEFLWSNFVALRPCRGDQKWCTGRAYSIWKSRWSWRHYLWVQMRFSTQIRARLSRFCQLTANGGINILCDDDSMIFLRFSFSFVIRFLCNYIERAGGIALWPLQCLLSAILLVKSIWTESHKLLNTSTERSVSWKILDKNINVSA